MIVKLGVLGVVAFAIAGCDGERVATSKDNVTMRLNPEVLASIVASVYEVPAGEFNVCFVSKHGDHGDTSALHFKAGDKIFVDHDRPEESKVSFRSTGGSLTQDVDTVKVNLGTYPVALLGSATVQHTSSTDGSNVDVEHMFRITRERATTGIGNCDYRKKVISVDVCWRESLSAPYTCRKRDVDYGHVHADQ